MSSENELLRPVVGYEGLYSVTKAGAIWSHAKATGVSSHRGIWLKPWVTNGYLVVSLKSHDGQKKKKYVHRIVAMTWVENPDELTMTFINHKDGNRSNPDADNLEWCTRSMNIQHAYDTGLRKVTQKMIENMRRIGKREYRNKNHSTR